MKSLRPDFPSVESWKRWRASMRRARRTPLSEPPGTLIAHPEAHATSIRVLAYGPDEIAEEEIEEPQWLHTFLSRYPVVWVNVVGLGNVRAIATVGKILRLHRLALEDAVNVPQRTKTDEYDTHLFMTLRMIRLRNDGEPMSEQVSFFLGQNFLVTVQEREADCFDPVRERIRNARGKIRSAGPDYLAYSLLDAVIEEYFPVVDVYGEQLERVEDEVIVHLRDTAVARVHHIRRDLFAFRRAIAPLDEAIHGLLREECAFVKPETRVYLRDLHDHAVRVTDLIESYRELGSDLINLYLSTMSNRMNEVMKVLTIIATIFIPLSFIAGVYGMNFDTKRSPWNMPELHWYLGYPFSLLIMAVVAGSLLIYFRRKGWL